MSDTLVGIVSFGNWNFTKLTIESIRSKTKSNLDFFIVFGKDDPTGQFWCNSQNIPFIVHPDNKGFPYSINDIYDYAWLENNYKYLVITGNDIVPYEGCIDTLIDVANTTDYIVISALQYDVRQLCSDFPEARRYFNGDKYLFSDFNSKPWEMYYPKDPFAIADMQMLDIQNCCLYKKEYFDVVGYTDVNCFPCLDPDTLILNDKLLWVPISSINVGDKIVGVDAEIPENSRHRSYRRSVVEEKRYTKADCVKINFSDGRNVICSKNHRWLVRSHTVGKYHWQEAGKLILGNRICAPLTTWKKETSFDAGWLSGLYDGEGCISRSRANFHLSVYQKKGIVLDKIKKGLDSLGIKYHEYHRQSSTAGVLEIDKRQDVLETLGRLQPIRLIEKHSWDGVKTKSKNVDDVYIESIEDLGIRDVVDIQVESGAFLANGLVSHNCYFIDNDLAMRIHKSGMKCCTVVSARFFHFWSRTIHQGSGGSTNKFFELNKSFYVSKWGGLPGQETRVPAIKIDNRAKEEEIIQYWKKAGR